MDFDPVAETQELRDLMRAGIVRMNQAVVQHPAEINQYPAFRFFTQARALLELAEQAMVSANLAYQGSPDGVEVPPNNP